MTDTDVDPALRARLPDRVQELLDQDWAPRKGRSKALKWLAYQCAQAGLTNHEMLVVLAARAESWTTAPVGGSGDGGRVIRDAPAAG